MDRKQLLVLSFAAIVFIVGLQFYVSFFQKNEYMDIKRPLERYLTKGQWNKLALGSNDHELVSVKKLLQFSEAIYYNKDNLNFYMAYWEPGLMPYDLVGFHSPDVCWVEAGWKKEDEGVFSKNGEFRYVKFYHLVGHNLLNSNNLGYDKSFYARVFRYYVKLKNFFQYGFNARKDQLVIRIDSDIELEKNKEYHKLIVNLNEIKGLNNL